MTKQNIVTAVVLASAMAFNVSPSVASDPVFTKEQLRLIKAMIAEERELLRKEVRQEVLAEMNHEKTSTEVPVANATQIPAEASSIKSEVPINLVDTFFNKIGAVTIDRVLDAPPSNEEKTGVGFELSTMNENNRATLKLKRVLSTDTSADLVGPPGSKKGMFSTYSLSASAPISKDSDITNVATLDGFANAFELAGSYTNIIVPGMRTSHLDSANEYTPEFVRFCKDLGLDPDENNGCDMNTVKEKLKALGRANEYAKYKAYFFDPKKPVMYAYGVQGKIGYQSFDYFEQATLDKRNTEHAPWSGGMHVGFIPPNSTTLFILSGDYQKSYKAAKTSSAFLAGGTGVVNCVTGSIGAPDEKEKYLVSGEMRSLFSNVPLFKEVAMSLKVTRDLKNDETGVDFPIYLFNDGKGNLNGGVRAGWTDTDDFTFGVFVGSNFNFSN